MRSDHYRRTYHFLYTREGFDRTRTFLHRDGSTFVSCPCYYCGDCATTQDHAYPLVALAQLYGLADLPSSRVLVVVPACAECNSLLGDKVFLSLTERKQAIRKQLRNRYKRILAIPLWSEAELGRLDRSMQEYVMLGLRQKELTEERLHW